MTTRPTVLASIVLALALSGDSLLYAVLPLHAASFEISLAWAGVLLAANRIVRLLAYPFLPRFAAGGLRRFTIGAAALGAASTLTFAVGSGPWPLLTSRLMWGVAFGCLSLSSLAYAMEWPEAAGKRVGIALSLRELGPLLSLTLGSAAVAAAGVRPTLAALGVLSLAGVAAATMLPEVPVVMRKESPSPFLPPFRTGWLSALSGFASDGVFPATIGLLIARSNGAGDAVVGAGLLLALKRVAVVVLAPATGQACDRFGERVVTAAGLAVSMAGALMLAINSFVAGAILMSCGAAAAATTLPIAAAVRNPERRAVALARVGMMRDAGAAAGALVALPLFGTAGAGAVYLATALLLAGAAIGVGASGVTGTAARTADASLASARER